MKLFLFSQQILLTPIETPSEGTFTQMHINIYTYIYVCVYRNTCIFTYNIYFTFTNECACVCLKTVRTYATRIQSSFHIHIA